jgi:hypothetical protein
VPEILGGVALAARYPLYDLYGLAVLDHALEAKVYPTIIAAAGRLVGENFGGFCAYTLCVHSSSPFLWAGSRGVATTRGIIFFPVNLILGDKLSYVYSVSKICLIFL